MLCMPATVSILERVAPVYASVRQQPINCMVSVFGLAERRELVLDDQGGNQGISDRYQKEPQAKKQKNKTHKLKFVRFFHK